MNSSLEWTIFNFLYFFLFSKEDWLEENLYQQMSLTASAFAYTWSKWNADCGKDKFILQAIEQLEDEPPLEVHTGITKSN